MSEYSTILYDLDDRIARITFNRPEKRNALNLTMREEMVDALKRAEANDSISLVVLAGAGDMFCSGFDMTPGARMKPEQGYIVSPEFDTWVDPYARKAIEQWLVIWDLMKPVVCKVHGGCYAGGTEVMSICDVSFANDSAKIGYPPMRAQASPDAAYFAWKMTMARAKYLQLTGNIISGRTAADWGWITKSFADDEFEEMFEREVRAMASIPQDMLAANKMCLNQAFEIQGFRTGLQAGVAWHNMSAFFRPSAGQFSKMVREKSLKEALAWRDGAFKEIQP